MSSGLDWPLRCTACGAALEAAALDDRLPCPGCHTVWQRRCGIWDFLPRERAQQFEPFLSDYLKIRREEQRGSESSEYYLRLPETLPGDPLAVQWAIRRQTFEAFMGTVLPMLGAGLRILDCGAGCAWLSHHLHQRGHFPCSVDVNCDDMDGLGAARHFAPAWPLLRAEFDTLPLAPACADVVLYNGSLHYSANYEHTLSEALRVLAPGGHIVVLDSPIYLRAGSGAAMVTERRDKFIRQFGAPPAVTGSIDYLDVDILATIKQRLSLDFRWHRVWYGWRWVWQHQRARLRGERERATFSILVARRPAG